ncbi:MAG: Stp1/IreP family PP2C-type Ser/Thr phosphatase [Syntrophomonadaceae bacterium]|nr:Stp1/IreP family PP2C-type Ser/Thr phosphatase [Syntrophomonadaceae bacterium]
MKVVGITDIGLVRQKNEDSFLIDEKAGLFVVCDGMGGHRAGEIASGLTINAFKQNNYVIKSDPGQYLINIICQANTQIFEMGQNNAEFYEMGTTVTAAIVTDNFLTVANVGDSSLFLIRNAEITKLTHDHTVAEQMVNDGVLHRDDIRSSSYNHVLTRAIGIDVDVEVDIFEQELLTDDLILLCSDGLTDMLTITEIADVFNKNKHNIEQIAEQLLNLALQNGGKDNITIVLLWFN